MMECKFPKRTQQEIIEQRKKLEGMAEYMQKVVREDPSSEQARRYRSLLRKIGR